MATATSIVQTRPSLRGGTGASAGATATRMPSGGARTRAVALGDVDGDGDLDMVFGNAGFFGQQHRLYLNDGSCTSTDTTAAPLPPTSGAAWRVELRGAADTAATAFARPSASCSRSSRSSSSRRCHAAGCSGWPPDSLSSRSPTGTG